MGTSPSRPRPRRRPRAREADACDDDDDPGDEDDAVHCGCCSKILAPTDKPCDSCGAIICSACVHGTDVAVLCIACQEAENDGRRGTTTRSCKYRVC
jgi:hypothetical protein